MAHSDRFCRHAMARWKAVMIPSCMVPISRVCGKDIHRATTMLRDTQNAQELGSLAELTGSEARAQSTRFRTLTVPIRFANAVRKATPPAFDMCKCVHWTDDPR